jgi:hypothetical protein
MNPQQEIAIQNYFANNPEIVNYYLSQQFQNEVNQIDQQWTHNLQAILAANTPLRMVIFAEAPKCFQRYFYNNPGNFLTALKSHYNDILGLNPQLQNITFINFLNQRGILLFDLYQYPFPPEFYTVHHNLFLDTNYVNNKLTQVQHLFDACTKFTFRYQMIINRNISNIAPFNAHQNRFLIFENTLQRLYQSERPQIINPNITEFL